VKTNDFEALLRANEVEIPENFMDFLKKAGYFTLPASVNHHGNIEGGLYAHSLCVAETLLTLTQRNHLEWQRPGSPVIVGLFHDLCKLETYKWDFKQWGYADSKDQLYTGHGDKSVLMLAGWMQLIPEEVACIRWHMGAFDDQANWSHYTAAVRKFPNVLWTHQADMIASHILKK